MVKFRFKYFLTASLIAGPLFSPSLFAETKSLTRVDDPIVLVARDALNLFGAPVDQLALMALTGGAWSPIPFQIDQKKPDGNYAFTAGPEAGADPDPNLDANDELVFMVKDIGDRGEAGPWPEGAKAGAEIEVKDPKNGARGWAYLFRFPAPAPRSTIRCVRIDRSAPKGRDRIVTQFGVFEKDASKGYPDFMARLGPDGSAGPNLMDRFKLRTQIRIPSLKLSWDFRLEDHIISEDAAWMDGPVRVMYLNKFKFRVTSYITLDVPSHSVISYYGNQTINPITYEQPKVSGLSGLVSSAVNKIMSETRMDVYFDFTPAIYGAHFFSDAHPRREDVVADGQMSEAEKNLDRNAATHWIAADSPQGTVVLRAILPPSFSDVVPKIYYRDDQNLKDPPERVPGVTAIGYTWEFPSDKFSNPETVTGMVIRVYVYLKGELQEGDLQRILDVLDDPVKVAIRPLASLDQVPAPEK